MQPFQQRIVTALLVITTCFGCTDKDREMARRTSDGSDTFKFKPPASVGGENSSSAPSQPSTPAVKSPAVPSKDSDGSDTFHFKRDARTLPKAPPAVGKR